MTVAMLRALPAGLLLVMIVRQIPTGIWWMRIFILGALNISLFWSLLFISVYRLPGGVAATVGAVQPLMVVFISAALLGSPIRLMAVLGAICGTAGVALLVLTPNAALDDAPRDKCTLSCAINGIHAAFHYLKKNYISGCVMTVPTGW